MSSPIDPDQFIITRKRKKYKFAKFANAKNCYEFEEWTKQPVDIIEIGAGTGLFGLELARRNPDKQVVALDVKADRLQKGAYQALADGVDNISFVRARADQIDQLITPGSVEQVWVTFPDPFPRDRSEKRRMTHPIYLEKYQSLLGETGAFYLKHDSRAFFRWSLEQLVAQGWHIRELSFDLHDSRLSDDYKIMTTYEHRWTGEGLVTNFVKASSASNSGK